MITFDDLLAEHMKNPKFKEEWDALEEEYQIANAKMDAEIAAEEAAGIVHHPTYEEAIAWMKDYKVANV